MSTSLFATRTVRVGAPLVAAAILLAGCSDDSNSTAESSTATTTVAESSSATTVEVTTVPTPRLASADNFRDLAGPGEGYETSDGKHVKQGVIYRSNALALTPADVTTLEGLGITAVYDLRTPSEITAKPDVAIAGATNTNIDIVGDQVTAAAASFDTPELASAFLEDMNRQFVNNPAQRAHFGELLTSIANTEGPQLIHCTAGKDRTGWSSAILLSIAGVSREDINANYLLTNEYSKDSIAKTTQTIAQQKGQPAAYAYGRLLGVQQSYLDAGFDEINAEYGSVDNYLTKGLGLSPETITAIKTKLVG
jgi:protein-tyrosine phosphatase